MKYYKVQIKRDGVGYELYCVRGRLWINEDTIELPKMDIALFYTPITTAGLTPAQKGKLAKIRKQLDDSKTWYVYGCDEHKFGVLHIKETYSIIVETLLGEVNLKIDDLILKQ